MLLLWIWKKLPGTWWPDALRKCFPWMLHLCNCANSKVLMKSETRLRTVCLQQTCRSHSCISEALQSVIPAKRRGSILSRLTHLHPKRGNICSNCLRLSFSVVKQHWHMDDDQIGKEFRAGPLSHYPSPIFPRSCFLSLCTEVLRNSPKKCPKTFY